MKWEKSRWSRTAISESGAFCAVITTASNEPKWLATIYGNDPEWNQGQVIAQRRHDFLPIAKLWAEQRLAQADEDEPGRGGQ